MRTIKKISNRVSLQQKLSQNHVALAFALIFAFTSLFAAAACGRNDTGTGAESDRGNERGADSQLSVAYTIPEQPEFATGLTQQRGWETSEFAVAAGNPLATDAGYQVLRAGGSAADAAIAIQMVLTLVEPQSSGIGGGAFVMHWDGAEVTAYNGRETAPAAAGEDLFLDVRGEPIPFTEAVHSGLSVGVPGTVAVLRKVHEKHGRLPWSELFQPAITLAKEGFAISPRLHRQLDRDRRLCDDDIARSLYYDDEGKAHPVGYRLRNPALAEILSKVAGEGPAAFYEGPVASSIVDRIRFHPRPGAMSRDDLSSYPHQDLETDPICTPWRQYTVCGFPPPSSGHLTVMQILGILEESDLPDQSLQPVAFQDARDVRETREARDASDAINAREDTVSAPVDTPDTAQQEDPGDVALASVDAVSDSVPTPEWLHYYFEASKLAFADRNRYIADPRYVEAPGGDWETMLNPSYLKERAGLMGPQAMERAEAGQPAAVTSLYGAHPWQPDSGTSHISIIDRDGNAVSMTTTIEQVFGSRIMSDGGTGLPGGFHLNNELTDFSLRPVTDDGDPVANRVEPGKRPRSSMAPSLIFDTGTGELVAAVGSPGGAGIIHFTAKAILGMYDFGLNAQEAINLPNFVNYNGPSTLERDRFPQEIIDALEERGHVVLQSDLTSGLQAIQRTENGFFGGADPRREGVVMGD